MSSARSSSLRDSLFHRWAKFRGTRPAKSQWLEFTSINGRPCKRVVLRDSYLAGLIEESFDRFGPSPLFSRVLLRFENEVWVEFVEGTRLEPPVSHATFEHLVEFFVAVHSQRPRRVRTDETIFATRMRQDIELLAHLGVIDGHAAADLRTTADRITPESLWLGFDYLDPVLKNFIYRKDDGRLIAIDVESLRDDQLIGFGLAKACVKWLHDERRDEMITRVDAALPGFADAFAFVELAFLARWTKRVFIEGKMRSVDPTLLERFRGVP